MVKSNEIQKVILDTDVIINWLTQEVETATRKELWKAPYKIITFIENKRLHGLTCLTTLLEIRYLLRRKREYNEKQIENFINEITSVLEVVIPDEISLLEANKLQSETFLDPFDAILLGVSSSLKSATLISRDKQLLKIGSRLISTATPESLLRSQHTQK